MLELIVSDMDGTLLNGQLQVHPDNIEAIMHTYSLGIPFIVATGRNFKEAQVVLDKAGIRCPIIGLNGAILFDRDGKVQYEIALNDSTARSIIQYGQNNGYYMEAMTAKNVYSNSKQHRLNYIADVIQQHSPDLSREEIEKRAVQAAVVTSVEYLDDLTDLIDQQGQHILKIVFIHEGGNQVLSPLAEELNNTYWDIATTSSFYSNLEVSATRANKGEAVASYCHAHGYHPENIMTIGDNLNDIQMIRLAGYSFAMGNAEEEVKQAAKYQTANNNEGGVAKAIQKALKLTHSESLWQFF
ncbi:Cof-like hydrolase [Aerococcus christensenii]|uniref:Cof-like hydrolase n=1 Tax=Aerococcus christensenii TaxID=87541 RepID=A0A133XUB1_9LACT|nr:Cof-type HAD-IIB family hydrolase [Aerococcus christensenii]KXB34526.1 Cof-like hydrolase [Aerococcus christensenii]